MINTESVVSDKQFLDSMGTPKTYWCIYFTAWVFVAANLMFGIFAGFVLNFLAAICCSAGLIISHRIMVERANAAFIHRFEAMMGGNIAQNIGSLYDGQ